MPIEIRELIIKAQVNENEESSNENNATTLDNSTIQKIIQECTDSVLEIIKNEKER